MKRIVICDEDENNVSQLGQMIEKLFPEYFLINGYVSSRQLLYELEDDFLKEVDLFFIDLGMKEISGIHIAKHIQQKLPIAKVVYMTEDPQRVEEIFDEIYPLGLLLKPLNKDRVEKFVRKSLKFEQRSGRFVKVKKNGRWIFIPVEEVLYVESKGRKLLIHKNNGIDSVYERIFKFCDIYRDDFVRCHQSYAVNWNCITEMSMTEITLKNGEKIPVSRQRYRDMLVAIK